MLRPGRNMTHFLRMEEVLAGEVDELSCKINPIPQFPSTLFTNPRSQPISKFKGLISLYTDSPTSTLCFRNFVCEVIGIKP